MKDEIELEVFRADTRASRGITAADIAALNEFDCAANPIPAVIGHPKSDSPAKGLISKFRTEGSKLFATLTGIKPDLVEGVKNGELINRSMAFFGGDHEANPTPGKLAPRHLGFLGGSAPGIPGMSSLKAAFEFNADAGDDDEPFIIVGAPAPAILFESGPTEVFTVKEEPQGMTPEQIKEAEDKIAADRKALEDERAEFNASAETSRKAANKSRVDALVTARKVLPADSAALAMVFDALDGGELEFAAGDKGTAADKLAAILAKGPELVDTGGRKSPLGDKAPAFTATGNTAKDAATLTAAARELMKERPELTFEAALAEISEAEEG